MNLDPEFSIDSFIKYLQTLDIHKQKRMLFMAEAEIYLHDQHHYDTNFGTYPDHQNFGFDKIIRTPFYKNYFRLLCLISEDFLNKPDDEAKSKWEELKIQLLEDLKFNKNIFSNDYEGFKIGLKLKALRLCSKKEFAEKSGLSIGKIGLIEDFGFLARLNDINQYVEQGLERKFNLNFTSKQV